MNIDAADKLRLQAIAPWVRRCNREIERRIADARAHAERSVARSNASAKHAVTAEQRLEELMECLIGSEINPLRGVIQDARAGFYHRAFQQTIPESIRDPRATGTHSGEASARELRLWGLTPMAEMQAIFLPIRNSLKTTIALAKQHQMDSAQRATVLDTWEAQAVNRIGQAVLGMLSNSEVAIFNLVGHSMIKAEMRAARGKRA